MADMEIIECPSNCSCLEGRCKICAGKQLEGGFDGRNSIW